VDENLPLAPGERVLINRILAVAGHYKRLKKFIDDIVLPQKVTQTTSMYNYCFSITQAILSANKLFCLYI
jgi:hypothetical protein